MKRTYLWFGLVIGFLILLWAGISIFISRSSNNPQAVTKKFYTDWISGKTYSLSNESYRNISAWTPGMVTKIDVLLASTTRNIIDPVYCLKDKPKSVGVAITEQTTSGASALVIEKTTGVDEKVVVYLKLIDGKWRIDNILCRDEQSAVKILIRNSTATSTAAIKKSAKALVTEYVTAHVGDLSPQKETIGTKFAVTRLGFDERSGTGVVNYEDGHTTYVADFSYSITESSGNVAVKNFTIRPQKEAPKLMEDIQKTISFNFEKTGVLAKNIADVTWKLVYIDEGQPELSTTLIFDKDSLCDSLGAGKLLSCTNVFWNEGDGVMVQAFMINSGKSVLVKTITKI